MQLVCRGYGQVLEPEHRRAVQADHRRLRSAQGNQPAEAIEGNEAAEEELSKPRKLPRSFGEKLAREFRRWVGSKRVQPSIRASHFYVTTRKDWFC